MKKTLFLIFYFLSFSSLSTGQDLSLSYLQNNQIKPAEEVFIFSYSKNMKIIKINWTIEDGYYLYLNSIFVTQQDSNIKYNIDEGIIKDHEDEFFGETKIIRDFINISLTKNSEEMIKVSYQGCSDQGFCYPVQNIKIN